jgi:hypothetical protein
MAPVSAAVKSIYAFGEGAPEDGDIEGYAPDDPREFGFGAQVFIGDDSDEASDSFDLVVCSPSWFAKRVAEGQWERFQAGGLRSIPDTVAVGSGIWFMQEWDLSDFKRAVQAVCEGFSPAPDWETLAARIGRLIPWEFAEHHDQRIDRKDGHSLPPASE